MDTGAGHIRGLIPIFPEEGEEHSLIHKCTVGWVRAFPHVDHDLPGRVWKSLQGREPKTFLGTGVAVAALDCLHLPEVFEEQELLQVQLQEPLEQEPLGQEPLEQEPLGQDPLEQGSPGAGIPWGRNPWSRDPLEQEPLGQGSPGAGARGSHLQ